MKRRNFLAFPYALLSIFLLVVLISALFITTGRVSHDSAESRILAEPLSAQFSWDDEEVQSSRALAINASSLTRRDQDYSCSATKPCSNGACCGSYQGTDTGVCGYGPTYCGSDCTSDCNAKAECGQYADEADEYCPLNVCCSQFGFCGTTTAYCDATCQNNCVEDPAVPAGGSSGSVLNRVIGYYEGWSNSRSCYAFPPSDIPTDGLTHANFAFAYIDPGTYEIVTMESSMPSSLFVQTTDIKTQSTNGAQVQIFVSVGGWSFSDNDTTTQPLFGEIAASASNRQKFADNLVSFMKEYGFDGVDIDWEYPGAGDRGGSVDDTENYVELLKTLRETFDASDGTYGISFTAPSSYWYLRWFDLPGMIQYADWINLMAYDLHGTWDSSDPIGNIVQGHTNLTEIKDSASLFWRVGIPPEKIILGLGFYGRSFTLEDSSCGAPGCPFSGGGDAGTCTDSSGTLAYFEIMDIKDKQSPEVVWDKTDAVKYFQYGSGKNQWISYDDSDTFAQKIDWANDVGLGGVMIWSIDQDTTNFDALGGLLGEQLTSIRKLSTDTKAEAGSWASQNGQSCMKTKCMKSSEKYSWGSDWAIAPNGDAFRDDCGSGKNRYIICPIEQLPSTCQWRGGESGRGCHGQCHTGEVTLFHSKHATVSCLSPGQQSFCCESNTWSALVDSCDWSSDNTCPSGKSWVALKKKWTTVHGLSDSWEESTDEALCCDSGLTFGECHWIGKGYCDDNECADYEIELDTDNYGNTSSTCASVTSRKKSLCCTPPSDVETFLPVPLDYLFPTTPPVSSVVDYDIDYIQDEVVLDSDLNPETVKGAFGWVVIDGPSDTVTSLTTRDESHIQFLDCGGALGKRDTGKVYTARYICMNDSDNSNCDAVHENGAEGTIVKLPENCGFAEYGVVHEIRPSENSTVAAELLKRAPTRAQVYEMDISYDFSRVKRDSGEVYFRIDYGDNQKYWNDVVAGAPNTKRHTGLGGATTQNLQPRSEFHKRFWSKNAEDWMTLFDNIRGDTLGTGYDLALINEDFYSDLVDQDNTANCSSTVNHDAGFLQAYFEGSVRSALRWGVSMVGTISPSLNIEEAYGFFDTDVDMTGKLYVNGYAELDIEGSTNPVDMFSSDISNYGWSHPGIGSFQPKMNIGVQVMGKGTINSNFRVYINSGSDGSIRTNAPLSLGDLTGTALNEESGQAWEGGDVDGTLPEGVDSGTLLGFELNVKTWLDFELDVLGETVKAARGSFYTEVPHRVTVSSDGETVSVVSADEQVQVEVYSSGISSEWEQDDSSHTLGSNTTEFVVYTAATGGGPDEHLFSNWDESTLISDLNLSCPNNGSSTLICYGTGNMSKWDDDWVIDPETGEEYSNEKKRSFELDNLATFWGFNLQELEKRGTGKKRNFTVEGPNGNFIITSHTYPNGQNGDFLLNRNTDAGRYVLANPADCRDYSATAAGPSTGQNYVTEHIVELGTHSMMLEFMMTGDWTRVDGSHYTVGNSLRVDQQYFTTYYQQVWSQWDTTQTTTSTPIDDVWTAFGDTTNPDVLVNMESTWNGIKMQMWQGNRVMAPSTWIANGFADTTTNANYDEPDPYVRAFEALSTIRAAAGVFEYLNEAVVNTNYATVLNDMFTTFTLFDESVNRATGATINTALLFRHFVYNCLNARMEEVSAWISDRLDILETTWTAALNGATSTQEELIVQILDNIENMREDIVSDDSSLLLVTTSGLQFPPPSANEYGS